MLIMRDDGNDRSADYEIGREHERDDSFSNKSISIVFGDII